MMKIYTILSIMVLSAAVVYADPPTIATKPYVDSAVVHVKSQAVLVSPGTYTMTGTLHIPTPPLP
jgi:hypothetical protein